MKYFVLAYFILLLYLPKIGGNIAFQLLPFVILAICGVYYKINGNLDSKDYLKFNTISYVLIFILTFGLLRSNKPEIEFSVVLGKALQLIVFIFALFSVILYYKKKKPSMAKEIVFIITILPFVLYCILNIVLWLLGIEFGNFEDLIIGKAVVFSYFGFDVDRVRFPLVHGINSFGTVVGGVFTLCLTEIIVLKRYTLMRLISIGVLLIILLFIDSRAAIIYPILISLICYFIFKKNTINSLRYLTALILIGPFLLVGITELLSSIDFVNSISRNDGELTTGNGRFVVWGFSLLEFSKFKLEHILGYGEYGHYASGASLMWANIFELWSDAELTHPHNTVLMILFDYGYVGLIVYLLFIATVVKNLKASWNTDRYNSILVLAFLFYTIMNGMTESNFGFYYLNSIYIFFSVTSVSFLLKQNSYVYRTIPLQAL